MMLEYGIRKLLDLGSLTFAFGLEVSGESCHFLEGEIPVLIGFEGPMELWRFGGGVGVATEDGGHCCHLVKASSK